VTIAISDHGEGVPVESLARLKEPFYRVDAARNLDNGGAGLGMSIVDNLVRTYGGEWTVRNAPAPATGLIVEIKLPLAGGDSVA
jgi:signal transduction histidine kinase